MEEEEMDKMCIFLTEQNRGALRGLRTFFFEV